MSHSEKTFISMWLLNLLNMSTYGTPIPFFPHLAKEKGFSSITTGLIFSIFPIGALITSFLVGKFMRFVKKDKMLLFFQISLCIGNFIFGLSYYCDTEISFLFLTLFSRFVHGLSIGGYFTILYSIVPEYWPNDIERKIALMEVAAGMGIGLGPVLGSLIYYFAGYVSVFVVSSIYCSVCGLYVILFHLKTDNIVKFNDSSRALSMIKILTNKEILITFLFLAFNFDSLVITFPTFENYLISLGTTPITAALIWSVSQLGYVIAIFFCKSVSEKINYKRIFLIFGFLNLFFLFTLGPDPIFQIESVILKLIIITVSMFFIGMSVAFIIVLIIPDFINLLNIIYPNEKELSNDMAAGLLSGGLSFAEILGPIIGGAFYEWFGFERGCTVFSCFLFGFLMIYAKTFWNQGIRNEIIAKNKELYIMLVEKTRI